MEGEKKHKKRQNHAHTRNQECTPSLLDHTLLQRPAQIQLQLLLLFRVLAPLRRAAGMLLETSEAVRKTLMPKGKKCRERADSVVAP